MDKRIRAVAWRKEGWKDRRWQRGTRGVSGWMDACFNMLEWSAGFLLFTGVPLNKPRIHIKCWFALEHVCAVIWVETNSLLRLRLKQLKHFLKQLHNRVRRLLYETVATQSERSMLGGEIKTRNLSSPPDADIWYPFISITCNGTYSPAHLSSDFKIKFLILIGWYVSINFK